VVPVKVGYPHCHPSFEAESGIGGATDDNISIKMEVTAAGSISAEQANSFASMLTGQFYVRNAEGFSAETGNFELDEDAFRALPQFMESQNLNPESMSNTVHRMCDYLSNV
jgi:hypothetical protein